MRTISQSSQHLLQLDSKHEYSTYCLSNILATENRHLRLLWQHKTAILVKIRSLSSVFYTKQDRIEHGNPLVGD